MFTNPEKNLRTFGLADNMIVADLGAGTGFYSIAAAHIVSNGKVYAVEVQKDLLHTITNKAKSEHLHNIEILWGDVEKIGGTKIGNNVADVVIASNILSQVEDKKKFLKEANRILKDNGRVLFIDKDDQSLISGAHNSITKDRVRALFEEFGFDFVQETDVGDHHYGMIFRKIKNYGNN